MIISSLLDNDFYKFTMMQFAFLHFPNAEVEYELFYRNKNFQLKFQTEVRLKEEIEKICELRFKQEEIEFLQKQSLFFPNFLAYLRVFSLKKEAVSLRQKEKLSVSIKGKWPEVILWEVILLSLISEIQTEGLKSDLGEAILKKKIDYLKVQPIQISFMEFGTRRRFSGKWQQKLNFLLKESLPFNYLGTSNLKIAMDYNLKCYGTMGHELLQAGQRICLSLQDFQSHMLKLWFETYQEPLSIALTDVLSLPSFLYDFKDLASKYVGVRVDSGNPLEAGEKIISFYEEEGINPLNKKLIFSDGIKFPEAITLATRFQHRINLVFGIGTYLTNDHGISPPNLVIKMTHFNGGAVGKLTDTPEKSFCQDLLFLKKLQNLDRAKRYASKVRRDVRLMDRAILKIKDRFHLQVSIKDLTERATLRNLAKFVEGDLQFLSISKKLREEDLQFLERWTPPNLSSRSRSSFPQKILMTGVTGFLGSHLLLELYQSTTATIYVLIRSKNKTEARQKLKKSFQRYQLADLSERERIIPIPGDLTKTQLGIRLDLFKYLSEQIDVIYHAGSFIHHIYDYQTLRHTNVLGTQELIKLAMTFKKKPFYYISSVVAAIERDETGKLKEEFPQDESCGDIDGYSQTKWVCEKILEKASKCGLPVLVFRAANITGRQKDGVSSPEKDHMFSLIKGCIQMGLAPNWDMNLNFVPVDFVSRFIVKVSLSSNESTKLFHIINQNRLSWLELIHWVNHYGYPVKIISEELWSETYLPLLTSENALFPLVGLYANGRDSPELFACTEKIDQGLTEYYQNQNGKKWIREEAPPINSSLLTTYFKYFHKCGYLKPP